MFRDKSFNIAFLISISWHISCMLLFTIVVLPAGFPMSKISNVSFLGPILEKTAFEMMLEKRLQDPKRVSYREPMNLDSVVLSHDEKISDRFKVDDSFLSEGRQEARFNVNELFGNFKFSPPFRQGINGGQRKAGPALSKIGENFVIEGPLADREITFKPPTPLVASRLGTEQGSFIVELKFGASSSGKIEEVGLLASSGFPDVDLAAINYIKGFRFSSLGGDDKLIWGKVRLELKTK